ncbi:IS256 family transposase [Skermanella aerolata]|uniref:Mutator family transposase n=4 Tax=Skermanella aerolata TaxID=393310 RepID=A0A512E4T0_9PROT|nr:IS256 family transposase [Skermanella aerolata]GEO43738.1 IS256 family transposase [Skermanella aerolata]
MEKITANEAPVPLLGEDWFDPLEAGVRQHIRSFIEAMLESELEAVLNRGRYERAGLAMGHRHGHRDRQILGTFGPTTVSVPRARLVEADGRTQEWRNQTLPAYKRLTKRAEALIAGIYLAGTNTRRVRRALGALFGGAVGKDTVSRAWRKVQGDWEAWQRRDLSQDDIVRVILDGTVVKVRLDKRSTGISVLVALGVRRDGQKVLLGLRNMGGESEAAWRAFLDDLVARKLATPELLIIDGAPGLEAALAALWPTEPVQRCTVHKHRNLVAHAPKKLHDEISADYTDMIYGKTVKDIEARRKAFVRKWRLKCPAVAASLEEAGANLFTFLLYPPDQWKSIRTTNAIERLHEEFKRRIKTQCLLPCAETACMLFWALLASGQITLRRVDGWDTLHVAPNDEPLDLAA